MMDTQPLHMQPSFALLDLEHDSMTREEYEDSSCFAQLLELQSNSGGAGEQDESSSHTARGSEIRGQSDDSQRDPEAALISAPVGLPVLELGGIGDQAMLDDAALRKLSRVLWEAVRKGEQSVELKLLPRQLGNLQIRITLVGNQVHLIAQTEDPEVAKLLLAHQHELAASLARWGLQLGSFKAGVFAAHQAHHSTATVLLGEQTEARPMAELRRSFMEIVI